MRNGMGRLGGMQRGRFLTVNPESRRCVRFTAKSLSVSDEFRVLGLTPLASKSDVKHAYKRLALKYHPDVIREENSRHKPDIFKDIKSAYESLMEKFEEEEESRAAEYYEDEFDEWEEWMGFEGGIPAVYNPS
ncbi:chaperone protein dnaJ 8, chloroplastic [Magnolia sinica]|uniref:chaperone protein dnaJ 8, chloroplastic n=1 Tax=Magnolia sinica TaxID=86752 RepID=UPI002657CB88|nr:chaperone protein dnaJ 8, chloroplastic [Magnolia sinica]